MGTCFDIAYIHVKRVICLECSLAVEVFLVLTQMWHIASAAKRNAS